jgi:flagellar basal-body rod protein FlgF
MQNSEYISLSLQTALRVQMDVVANNLANMNTTAYKSEHTLFKEYLVETDDGEEVSFVQDWGLVRDTSAGKLNTTGNPLDVAISGDGYFVVETESGIQYTRNGHFRLNDIGQLVTGDGSLVLDDGAQPILFTEFDTNIKIAADGTISTDAGVLGRLDVVNFENQQLLKKAGNSQYTTDQAPFPATAATTVQGMIEGSNVNSILEMTDMIRINRAYQSNASLQSDINESQREMLRRIATVI